MARSKITSASKDLVTDDGAVLVSVVKGEQIHLNLTLSWLTNISNYEIFSKVVEAANDGSGAIPETVKPGGVVVDIPLLDTTDTNNQFVMVIPETLIAGWSPQPSPNKPVYGYIDLEIRDTGIGSRKQVWKPFRGLVEVRYSPTEV
jgi:hypothetical protein